MPVTVPHYTKCLSCTWGRWLETPAAGKGKLTGFSFWAPVQIQDSVLWHSLHTMGSASLRQMDHLSRHQDKEDTEPSSEPSEGRRGLAKQPGEV